MNPEATKALLKTAEALRAMQSEIALLKTQVTNLSSVMICAMIATGILLAWLIVQNIKPAAKFRPDAVSGWGGYNGEAQKTDSKNERPKSP